MRHRFPFLARWGPRLALLGALGGCVEPYAPDVIDAPASYLVVDGFINGNGRTTILLTRTASLAAPGAPAVEKGAKIFIADDTGARYALTEKTSGTYQSDSLVLSPARRYQLRFTRAAGAAAYASDLVPLKVTPAIDQLGWTSDGTQVQLALSTHDAQQQTRYYRWGITETYEFHSAFNSTLEYDPGQRKVVFRTTPIYTCWQTARSSAIRQGSTAQLSQDVLTNFPLLTIPGRAERLAIRYSALVSQYAETAEEFAYYELLRKNTEAVGTVNDPLPVQLTGNVHRVDNAQEPVLGYVGAHTVQTKRLFIARAELPLPANWAFDNPYQSCTIGDSLAAASFVGQGTVPIAYVPMVPLYTGATRECVDCRLRGSNLKPSFW
ncbi:DUF4249 domain-containing protein [Hymenobacter coccineus]|uniref:DUF4249 domain-containing protein n=1 Tax=Hymenobacter coccineus TaxID=1908235 RepID=A0A1G1TID0_9BACT|nr:DUF4249 domain-containing protein [Hymenobacter coccineus]OGX90598.1 hypothetical protein BEN49_22265 [Hymenobacter coccineus]